MAVLTMSPKGALPREASAAGSASGDAGLRRSGRAYRTAWYARAAALAPDVAHSPP